jgi:hypothetical protein
MNTLIKTACLTCVLVLLSITSTANAQQSTNLVAEISEEWYDPFEPNSNTYNESKGDIQFGADPYDGFSPIYALSLPTSGKVTLVLDTGANIDGYLYLLNSDYEILSEDDNSGEYERSSITQTLDAGTYYVVPTGKRTNSGYVERFDMNIELYSDDFEANDELLKVVNYDSIKSLIGASQVQYYQDEAGSWQDTSGQSYTSAGNPRYKVVLTEAAALQISLESETDSYLYLLDENLNILEKDDDDGVGLDARISQTLAAGTYYVVAATFSTFNNSGTAFTLNLLSKDIMSDDISVELEAVTAENLSINIRMTLGNEQKDVYGVGAVGILQITPFENSDSTCQPLLYIFDIDRKVNPGGQKEGVSSTLEMPVFNACEYDMKLDLLQNTVFRQASGTFPAVLTAEDYLALTDGQKLSFRQLDNNNPGHSYSYGTFSVTVNENGAVTDTVRLSETREDNLGKFTNGNSSLRIEAGVSTDRADLDLQVQQDLYDQIDNIVIASGSDDEVILTFQNTTEESTKGSIFHINRSGSEEGVYITQSLPLLNSAYSYSAVYLKGGQKYNKTGEFTFTRGNGNNDVKGNLVFDLNSNTPPLANDQEINIYEETVLTFDLDVSDVDGDVLTYLLLSQGSKGSVEISQDGNATYFANPGATGTDTFTYRASDGTADSNEATVTMTIDAAESRQISVTGTVNFDDLAEDFGLGANVELNVSPFDNAPSYCGSFSFSFSATTENIDDTRNMTVHNRCEYDLELIIDGDANDFDRQRGTFSVGVVNNNIGIVKSSGDGVSADVTSLTIGGGISTDTGLLDAHIQQQVRGEIQDIVLTGNDDIYMEYTNQDFPKLADKIFSSLKTDGVFISQPLPLVTSEYAYSIVYVKGGEELTQTGSFSFNTGNANPTATFSVVFVQANTPPVISGTPATTVAQGTNYSFTPSAADQDPGTNFTFSIDNMPTWALFNAKTGNLTGTPGANDVGTSSNIIITVSDGEVPASLVAFAITVSNVNDAPVISGTPATTVAQGTNYSFTPTASDADTDTTLTFSIDNMPTWASFNAKTGSLTGTPSANDVSTTSNIVITVEDGEAEASLAAFAITVSNINDAPVISGTPATTVAQGTNYSFTPTASDADTDTTLTFSIDNKPNWAVFNAQTGSLTGTPSANDVGSTSGIVITVSDGDEQASLAFAITVSNFNDAPVISGTPSTTVAQGTNYSFTPTASDADTGTTLTFTIDNMPTWASFNAKTGNLTGTPGANDVGTTSNIVITVEDGEAEASLAAFAITVSNINDAPVISGTPATTVAQGTNYSFTPTASDADTDTTLTFSIDNKPNWAVFNAQTGSLTGTPSANDVGSTSGIVITVSDGDEQASLAFAITVSNVNYAPVFTNTPALTVAQGSQYSFIPIVTDPDSDDTFTFSITSKPAWAEFSVETGSLIGTPGANDEGISSIISITVSDSGTPTETASLSFSIEVSIEESVDEVAPVLAVPADTTFEAIDASGIPVTNAGVVSLLAQASATDAVDSIGGISTPVTNNLTGTHLPLGETTIVFMATDESGNTESASTKITVVDTTAPVLTLLGQASLTVEIDETFVDPGFTALDNVDGDLSTAVVVTGQVDINTVGDYVLSYNVSDAQGNASQSMTRQVKVTDGLPIIQAPVALTVFTNSVDGLSVSDAQVQGFLNSATASDKQDGEITTISNDAPQTLLAGETIVIFIVTDSTGNVSNAQSTITVVFDAEAPMVAETATLSVEATGTLTEVSLTAPEVTDNRSSDLTATPSDNGPFPLGDTEVIWQTVDMAGNTASRIQTVSIVDTTAPLFEDMTRITLEATGVSTNIDELLDIKAFDLVDGDIVAEIVGQILFGSGVHLITLSATDNQGQTATVEAEIAIIPLVIIAESAFASPGQTSTLALTLTGEAVIYPVTLNYTVSANNTAIEQSQVVIESGVDSAIEFTVDASMLADTELSVALTAAQNAILGEQTSGVITVTAVNLAPIAIISVSQQGSPTGIIALDGGDITVTAQVTDVGPATNYGFNWDESTLGNLGIDASVVLSVEQLTLGTMSLLLTLEELDTAEQFLVTVGKKLIVKQTLSLTSDADSDLDGMSDAMEGAGDSDDDGIPDYLDSDATANVLPVDNGASVIIAPVGIKLSLGAALVQASNGQASGVKITPQQLSEVFDSQPTEDDEYQAVGDIINFKASGLTQAGDSVTVIVQLADGLSVPAEAVYRKFSEVNGWLTFISDGNNQIASGNTDVNGNCPAFTNEMYLAGLVPGSNCIALTIQDGGIYDADGETNGQIEDPGVLAVESINLEPIVDTVNVVSAPEQSSFSLTATATDPEEQSLLYIWTQTAGTPVVIPDDSAETLAFTTPDVAEDEDLTFQLSVSDGVNEVLHTLVLTVLNVNSVPTLSASASASSALEESSVSFTATANDADGQALTFTWVQLSGPDLNLGETTSNSFTVTLPSVASNSIVVLKVTVSDGIDSVSQEVSLTIQNQTTVTPTPTPPTPDGGGGGSIGGFTLFLLALGLFRLAYSRRKYHY